MIKLNRGECPKELTQEVKEELINLYAVISSNIAR